MKRNTFLNLLALVATLFGVLASVPANAKVIVAKGDNVSVTVTSDESTYQEILEAITAHFGVELHGEITDEAPLNVGITGNLEQLLQRVVGENNFLLVYSGQQAKKLVILNQEALPDLTDVKLVTEESPPATQTTVVPASSTRSPAPSVRNVRKVPIGNSLKAVTKPNPNFNLSKILQQQRAAILGTSPSSNRASNRSSNSQTRSLALQANGAPAPEAVRSMIQDSSAQLKSLVNALKALCPKGAKC